jgi:HEAT repeat protein
LKIQQRDPSPEVAQEFERWLDVLQTSEDPDQRWLAALSMVKLDSDASVYHLIGALQDPDPKVVVHVIYQLRMTSHPGVIFPIYNMGKHPDPRVREAVQRVIRAGNQPSPTP